MTKNNQSKKSNVRSNLIRFGLSGLLLWYVFSTIDMDKTMDTLKSANMTYIFYALLVFMVTQIFLLIRWFIFIKALNLTASPFHVTRNFFVGLFGNLFLPSAIGGDILKTLGLCKGRSDKTKVVASVLLDRLSGFASIVIVSVFSFIFGYGLIQSPILAIPIAIMAAGSLITVLMLFHPRIYAWGCRLFARWLKVIDTLKTFHDDLMLLKDNSVEGWKAIGLSCVSQLVFAFCWFLIGQALHQDISLMVYFIFVPLTCVASSVPSIGGLGVREAGTALLFARIGVESGVAVSLSLITFLFMVVVGLLGGIIYVSTLSSGRVQYHPSNEDVRTNES